MIKFLNPHDAVILSEMIVHGEQTFGVDVFWTKEGMLGPLIRRAMLMPHIEVTISSRLPNEGWPKEFDFVWHQVNHYSNDAGSNCLALRSFNDWLKFDEIDEVAVKHRYLNGGWINHGTDTEPNWGSHT